MAGYRWTRLHEQAPFAARDGAGLLSFRGRLWLLGGWNPGDKTHFPDVCNSEVWSSAHGVAWRLEVPQAPWEGRHTAGYAVHDGAMWIVGGDANQGHYQPDIWRSDDGLTWRCVQPRAPWGQRVLHHTVAFAGKLWVMGGQTLATFARHETQDIFFNDVWASEDGVAWTRVLEHAPWPARGMIGGAAVWRGRIWLLGGGTYDTPDHPQRLFYQDVWSTADGVHWTRHADAPWPARQYHEVAVYDNRLWVMEGWREGGGNRNDVWHSGDGETWTELPDTPWPPRHAASVTVHDAALWMIAGNNMTPDVWRLTPA